MRRYTEIIQPGPNTKNMRAVFLAAAILALLCCCERGHALYFHIAETELKCFIEEVPAETMIVGEWRSRDWSCVLCLSVQASTKHSYTTV